MLGGHEGSQNWGSVERGFNFDQAITFMTMQSKQYDGKNHKNDDLDKVESTQKDVLIEIALIFSINVLQHHKNHAHFEFLLLRKV